MTPRAAARFLLAAAVLSFALVNTGVRGDGNGYFAWVASAVVDRDLDFRNQYRHGNALFTERYFDDAGAVIPARVTAAGRLENQWAVGPAVLWAPWFLAAHAFVSATGDDPQDGYALPYRVMCALGSCVYALAAMWLSAAAAVRLGVSRSAALTASVVIWLSSSLLVYVYLLPFHVHAAAAFTVALFLWYGIARGTVLSVRQWTVWGALGGLMAMTYYLDAVFLLAAAPAAAAMRRQRGARGLGTGAAFVVAALAASLPHWLGKLIVYGSPLDTGYRDHFFWSAPNLLQTAFSANHGVILWTPIVAVGLAGFVWCARQQPILWGIAAASAVFYLVVASYENWHGLSSFGNRFFVSWTLPLVVGVSVVIDALWLRARRGNRAQRAAVIAAFGALVLWNGGLAFQWASKMMPNRGSVDVWQVAAQQRVVPGRALTMARRYLTDRDGLRREIEERDQQEWHRIQETR